MEPHPLSVGIDKIVHNEHRYRLLLQGEQKEAWPKVIKYAAAEHKVTKEKEAARCAVEVKAMRTWAGPLCEEEQT